MGSKNRDAESAAMLFTTMERMASTAVTAGITQHAVAMAVVMLAVDLFGPSGKATFDEMWNGCAKSREAKP